MAAPRTLQIVPATAPPPPPAEVPVTLEVNLIYDEDNLSTFVGEDEHGTPIEQGYYFLNTQYSKEEASQIPVTSYLMIGWATCPANNNTTKDWLVVVTNHRREKDGRCAILKIANKVPDAAVEKMKTQIANRTLPVPPGEMKDPRPPKKRKRVETD
jgi:hypothetical protein